MQQGGAACSPASITPCCSALLHAANAGQGLCARCDVHECCYVCAYAVMSAAGSSEQPGMYRVNDDVEFLVDIQEHAGGKESAYK